MEAIASMVESLFGKLFATCVMAMIPVVELRGAIPFGLSLGLMYWEAFLAALIGNLIPVPFIILFLRRIFEWLKTKSVRLARFVERLERIGERKSNTVVKYKILGLFILVAIPLPGTGAWTGSLVAVIMDLRLKNAFPAIALGVVAAGVIVTAVSYGIGALFAFG